MGVSVPIDALHYKRLKIISERLDLGVGRTVEYLIRYYLSAEMSKESIIDVKPDEYLQASKDLKEDKNQILDDSGSVSRYEIPQIQSSLAARIISNLVEAKERDSRIPLSPDVTSDSAKDKVIKPSGQPKDRQNSGVSGMPRIRTAKYCYNCGCELQ